VTSNKLRCTTFASQTRVNLDHPGIISTFDDIVVIKIIKRRVNGISYIPGYLK